MARNTSMTMEKIIKFVYQSEATVKPVVPP